jgi:hypothetical protein
MAGFLKSVLGLAVLLLVAVLVIAYVAWGRVPGSLSVLLTEKLKVPVSIEEISLSFRTVQADAIVIGNPRGSILPKAFSAQTTRLHAPLTEYLQDTIVIDTLTIDTIYLGLEFDSPTSTKGNWTVIMGNLQSSTRSSPKEEKPKSVLIKQVILTNISTEVVYKQDGGNVQKLPLIDRMELTNVSSQGGVPLDQLMNSVLGQMLQSVFVRENLKNMMNDILEQNMPSQFEDVLEPLKGLFN